MKRFIRFITVTVLLVLVCSSALADEMMPMADPDVASASVSFRSTGKATFEVTAYNNPSEIKVTSCSLQVKEGDKWVFSCSLDTPTTVVTNRNIYSATMNYGSDCSAGYTYRIAATYYIGGRYKTKYSNSVDF